MDFGQLKFLKGVVNVRLIDADRLEYEIWDSEIENGEEFMKMVRRSKTVEREEAANHMYPLKPCPFCGSNASWTFKRIKEVTCTSIQCELCGCQTKLFSDLDDHDLVNITSEAFSKAIRAWNRRRKV